MPFQSRLAGFLFFYWMEYELDRYREQERQFQSRLAGFLFFYEPNRHDDAVTVEMVSIPSGGIFVFLPDEAVAEAPQAPFQSRLAGFLFFYRRF